MDKRIAVMGYGRIGKTIELFLSQQGYIVDAFDVNPHGTAKQLDPNDVSSTYFKTILEPYDAVVTATPYQLNVAIAEAAIVAGTAYFDLTEDIKVADEIRDLASTYVGSSWVMPQCGLAPGAVNMIAHDLTTRFDYVTDLNIRVGALPITANNKMKYYLTWSSEGLVNEYCNPCEALIDGELTKLRPLEGLENLVIDGAEYEAFNTSGGIGTLINSLLSKGVNIKNANYKTIRYKGHRDLMHFLLDDLSLAKNQKVLVDIFNKEIPQVTDDVVVIYISAAGYRHGTLRAINYCRKIYGENGVTAIQRTTAAGVCAAVHYWASKDWSSEKGPVILAPEDIPFDELNKNPFWSVYR